MFHFGKARGAHADQILKQKIVTTFLCKIKPIVGCNGCVGCEFWFVQNMHIGGTALRRCVRISARMCNKRV